MPDSMIARWLKAMNPLHKPADRAEAERSARSMSIGLVLSLIASVPSTLWVFQDGNMAKMMREQYATMGLTANEIAMKTTRTMADFSFMLLFSGVWTAEEVT